MRRITSIPVIDIFAGPGGLGEGFSAHQVERQAAFNIALSIEKDPIACRTLELRKFYRAFRGRAPDEYFGYQEGSIAREDLFRQFPSEARVAGEQTWCAELGAIKPDVLHRRIRSALGTRDVPWVLIGGPPCQAYSIAGRSRMKSTHPDFEDDERHFLYREYLRIVATHGPAMFVMENVKGLLSSQNDGSRIFQKIWSDLKSPMTALRLSKGKGAKYDLYALTTGKAPDVATSPKSAAEFIVKAEDYGIPQSRHRVFIIGVRSDLDLRPGKLSDSYTPRSVQSVLDDLPALRSQLSRGNDSLQAWKESVKEVLGYEWMGASSDEGLRKVASLVRRSVHSVSRAELTTGSRHGNHSKSPTSDAQWYRAGCQGLSLHESRSHMALDLHRYIFAASYAAATERTPKMKDFPRELLPKHRNVKAALKGGMFSDRFRVQLAERPASTVTSHIAKDGHYFIHYDPEQCRSLTVREAARLQTFPDSFFFEGNRTEQYRQVGNAVPPRLAKLVADLTYSTLRAD